MLVEIIVTRVDEAIKAELYGANRLELIHSFKDGGLSPSPELIKDVCAAVTIPVGVMVRPHAESFIYDDKSMVQIHREIDFILSNTKAANIVYGSLTQNNEINFPQLESVITQVSSSSAGITFHRAIDAARDSLVAFKELQNYHGSCLKRVLSSGGKATAWDGVNQLTSMQSMVVNDNGVKLLVGSGVNPSNAKALVQQIGCDEIHLGTGVRNQFGYLDKALFAELIQSLK